MSGVSLDISFIYLPKILYSKKILKITEADMERHKKFLKTDLKKNFF